MRWEIKRAIETKEITKALKDKAVLNQNGSHLSDKNKDALVDEDDEENDA